jgi:hypothetical protein
MLDHERDLVAIEGRPAARFITKQPNIIGNPLIKDPSINSNLISVSPPKRIIRKNTQEIERDREVDRLSRQLIIQVQEVLKFLLTRKELKISQKKI